MSVLSNIMLLAKPDEIQDASINWSSTIDMIGQFFFLMLAFIFIIALVLYTLKIASKVKRISGVNNNLRVVESRSLGQNNYVHIVKVGSKLILVGASKENVTYLLELDKDDISDSFGEERSNKFEEQLTSHIKKILNRQDYGNKKHEHDNEFKE